MAFWEVGIIIDRPKPEKTAFRELGTWEVLLVCAELFLFPISLGGYPGTFP
jgi:hypothetical protein